MSKIRPKVQTKSIIKTWPMIRLGDVCEVRAGANYKDVEDPNGRYPIYGTGGIMGRASQYRCPAHSVIVGRKGTLDNPFLVHEPFWNIDTCFGVVPSEKIIPEYLFRFCQGFDFYSLVPASGRPSTTSDAVRSIEIPLPPLSVQREIVARLERELATVEKMKKGFEALAETAKAEFKAELKEVFEEISRGGAKTRRLGEIGRVITGTTPSKGNKSFYGGEWPFYKPADLNQGHNTIGAGDSLTDVGWQNARQLPVNSVLVTCIGATLGKTGIIRREGSCNQQINAIVCGEAALPEYVYYSILSPQFQSILWLSSNSTTLPMVNKSTFEKFAIPLPSLSDQREVVSRLDADKARVEKLEAKAREGVTVCVTMRKVILKEAFE